MSKEASLKKLYISYIFEKFSEKKFLNRMYIFLKKIVSRS